MVNIHCNSIAQNVQRLPRWTEGTAQVTNDVPTWKITRNKNLTELPYFITLHHETWLKHKVDGEQFSFVRAQRPWPIRQYPWRMQRYQLSSYTIDELFIEKGQLVCRSLERVPVLAKIIMHDVIMFSHAKGYAYRNVENMKKFTLGKWYIYQFYFYVHARMPTIWWMIFNILNMFQTEC